jgi:hypothetical protein
MLRRVAVVRTDVSGEPGASFSGWQESVTSEHQKRHLAPDVRWDDVGSYTSHTA